MSDSPNVMRTAQYTGFALAETGKTGHHSLPHSTALAASITWAASKQTYYTIRLLVDRPLVADAYRAYAYFRWVDDTLDQDVLTPAERISFVNRQQALVEHCYRHERPRGRGERPRGRGEGPRDLTAQEQLLVQLVSGDIAENSGLQSYIRYMMAVMVFDANRRGRLISQHELTTYTHWLATAVTEALHYFIGHNCAAPHDERRYLAATAAHISHMLRDTVDDNLAGYMNIPRELLEAQGISAIDIYSAPYRAWVQSQVQLAQAHFAAGKAYLAQVKSVRCRLAGYAYIARFAGVLKNIERNDYYLVGAV